MVAKQGWSVHAHCTDPCPKPADPPQESPQTAPINVAVVGVGRWGQNLLRVVPRLSGARLTGMADPDCSLNLPAIRRTPSLSALLADPTLHAVAIASPSELHAAHAQEALAAGKHVFVEKPLALSSASAAALCEQASRANLCLMVGHIMRYDPAIIRMRGLVLEGTLGLLESACLVRTRERASTEDPWWSLAPHDLSLLEYVLDSPIRSVACTTGARGVHAQVRLESGLEARIQVAFGEAKRSEVVVQGSAGSVAFSPPEGLRVASNGTHFVIPMSETEPLERELQHFVDCVRHGTRPLTDGYEGTRVVRALEAGDRSHRSGGSWQDVS